MIRDISFKPFRNQRRVVVGNSLLPETVAFITANGYTNAALISAFDRHIGRLITNNLFTLINAEYHLVHDLTGSPTNAQMLNQMKFNLVNPVDSDAAFRLAYNLNPTASNLGVKCNGSTQYINTFLVPSSTLTLNETTFGHYCNDTSNKAGAAEMGVTSASPSSWLWSAPRFSGAGGGNYGSVNDTGSGTFDPTFGLDIDSFVTVNRTSSTQLIQRRNGVQTFTTSVTATTLPTRSIYLGGIQNNVGGLSYASDRRIQFAFVAKFNNTQIAIYETSVNTLQGDIETALGLTPGSRKRY